MSASTRTGPAEVAVSEQWSAGDEQGTGGRELLGIGAAAAQVGVSERALRYYQQLGLMAPSCTTPGGLRRYTQDDLARVARIRELQTLLGLNLDEIAIVLRNEDRMALIRRTYHDERTSQDERQAAHRGMPGAAAEPAGHRGGQASGAGELSRRPRRAHRARAGTPGQLRGRRPGGSSRAGLSRRAARRRS